MNRFRSRLACAIGAVALALVALTVASTPGAKPVRADGGTSRHPHVAHASVNRFALIDGINECGSPNAVAVATGQMFECDYVTTTQINGLAPAGLVLTITGATGSTFTAGGVNAGSLPAGCGAVVGPPNVLTISCAANQAAPLTIETLVTGGATAGGISMTAAYNGGAPGASFPFVYQFVTQNPPGPAAVVTQATSTNGITMVACVDTTRPGFPIFVGDNFSCTVTFAGPNSASEVTVDSTGTAGATYTLSGQQTDTSSLTYYVCGSAQTNTACLTATITGTATGPGMLQFDIGAVNLGADLFYVPQAIFNATTPGGFGVLPVPPPMPPAPNPPLANANSCGSSASAAVAVTSAFECDFTTTHQINVGDPNGLVINAPGGTVITDAFLNPPGAATACFRTNTGATFTFGGCFNNIPAGTVVQVYLTGTAVNPAIAITGSYNTPPVPFTQTEGFQFDTYTTPAQAQEFANNIKNATPTTIACINTAPGKVAQQPLVVGDTFSCTVHYAGITPSFITVTPNATFTLSAAGQVTRSNGMVGYQCDPGVLTTASTCDPITFSGVAGPGTGPFAFGLTNFALGAALSYGNFAATGTSAPPITGFGAGGPFVFAAGGLNNPVAAAIGCANSNNNLDVAFPAVAGVMTGFAQIISSPPLPTPGSAPGVLSLVAPTAIAGLSTPGLTAVECGAVFQDNSVGGPFFGQDADPNTIPGGTITFSLGGFTANGLTIAVILESGLNTTHAIPCGDASSPTPGPPPLPGGLESCQGAVTGPIGPGFPAGSTVSPNPANIVHVALRQGVTFSLIGGISPSITISATYQRFEALGAIPGVTGSGTITTNQATIGIATPTYSMSLTPSPASIPAALGSTIGSTITAALSRATAFQCVSVTGGFSGFVVCGTPGGVTGTLPLISFVNGAEPGVVTFSTSSGVFGLPGSPTASADQVASVHCGAAPGTAPVFLVPFVGQPFSFSFSSCQSVSVTLFGGGVAGTAIVTAVYVGDFTGATATAGTTVALGVSAPTVNLTRGCNEVITGPTTPAAATATQVLALVSPSSVVVSIWQFNNGLHAFQALYFSTAGAPVDITSVGPNQSIFICVSGAATFTIS